MLKSSEEAEELAERFNQMADEEMTEMLDRLGNRIDEMLDEASSQAVTKTDNDKISANAQRLFPEVKQHVGDTSGITKAPPFHRC